MKPYFSFQWHITDECDQRCKHCYIFSAGDHTCLKSIHDIFSFMDDHRLKPLIGAVYPFDRIRKACMALDSGTVNGKIVVRID